MIGAAKLERNTKQNRQPFWAAYFVSAVSVPSAVCIVRVEPGGTDAADLTA